MGVRTRHSGRHGDALSPCAPTASEVSPQYPAWRCGDGDGRTGLTATGKTAPTGPTSRRTLCSHGRSIRGFHRPTFEVSAR
jgi:hypothetical protein